MLIDNNQLVRDRVYDFLADCVRENIKMSKTQIAHESGLGKTTFMNWTVDKLEYKLDKLNIINDYIIAKREELGLKPLNSEEA